jgi:hypothetical protein
MNLKTKLKVTGVTVAIIAFSTAVVLWLNHIEVNRNETIQIEAYKQGWKDGCDRAMDTINVILGNQVHSDSTTTRLTIGGSKDTLTYYLDHKHVGP